MPAPTMPEDLLRILSVMRDPSELQSLFEDLLTPTEMDAIGERWGIVKRLAAGESQRSIRDAMGASVSTVSRGSRQLKYGTGGFGKALAQLSAWAGEADAAEADAAEADAEREGA